MTISIYKNIKIKIKFLLFVAVTFTTVIAQSQQLNVIPLPNKIQRQKGKFLLDKNVDITFDKKDFLLKNISDLFIQQLYKIVGIKFTQSDKVNRKNIVFELHKTNLQSSEGYKIFIEPEQIKIVAEKPAGIFYGTQTLIQIINSFSKPKSDQNRIVIPAYTIIDEPRFVWRGMHLDVSRHFFSVDFIKKYLDVMALYKLNTFHWHLTDDQGWRIEIKKYPKLTEVGAWRKGTGKEEWNYFINPVEKGHPKYGGYYTQDEIKEIVKYAKERFITIIPEIELPGHSWSALYAYPELSCTGIPWLKPDSIAWAFTDPFCAGNEKVFDFFDNVFSEIVKLFPSEYIHIGGDEAKKTPWESCKKCQLRMKENNLNSVEELQSYFIKRIQKIINAKGRKIIGWDEILEGGLAPGAAVMSWRGEEGGIEAANHQHYVVMTPAEFMYFNHPQFNSKIENTPLRYDVITMRKVYSYDPIPKQLEEEKHQYILGAQGCLWSEYLCSEEIAENRLIPRIAALSEITWSKKENKNWSGFKKRLFNQLDLFEKYNIRYFIPPPEGLTDDLFMENKYKVEMHSSYPDVEIHYTIDNTEPTLYSLKYIEPFFIYDSTIIKAKTFIGNKSSFTISANIKKGILHKAENVKNLVEGLQVKYLIGQVDSISQIDDMQYIKSFILDSVSIPPDVQEDNFGLEFSGYIKISKDDIYSFYLTSDDGSRLFIDDIQVIDNDGTHGMLEKENIIALQKGYHKIKLLYFENKFGEGLKIGIGNKHIKKQIIPPSMFFHTK